MRRIGPRAVGAAALALLAFAGTVEGPPRAHAGPPPPPPKIPPGSVTLTFKADQEHRAPIKGGDPGLAGRTWGYWGRLTSLDAYQVSGSYRATCVWLANPTWGSRPKQRDSRMDCTVLMSFRASAAPIATPNGGTMVAQGLVRRPANKENLFARSSSRQVAIVGGTGRFLGRRGSMDLRSAPTKITVSLVP